MKVLLGYRHKVNPAQCSECYPDGIQLSAGKQRE